MGSDDLNQGDFNAKISDAVDELFNAVRQIEIDPKTNEVKELATPSSPASATGKEIPPLEMESDADSQAGSAPAPQPPGVDSETLSRLDQALMTLDWEVSRSNAGSMRDLLDKATREFDLAPLQGQGGLISLMHDLLVAMSERPENVPTSGPLALKSSLAAIKAAALEGQPYSDETSDLVEQGRAALRSVLPEQAEAAAAPQPTVASSSAPPLPQELQVTLKKHIKRLDQLLQKRVVPVETFFNKAPSLARLHVVMKTVRQQLAEQIAQLKGALAGEYGEVMPVADPVSISLKLGDECQKLMQYHLQVLNQCARRIAPIEKLFADMEGQHKLHAIHFELRSGLTTQLHYVAAALNGDFGPLPPLPKLGKPADSETAQAAAAPPAATAAPPWSTLKVGRWRGEHIAFIPEQICFEGPAGFGAGNIARQATLKLNKLKPWPWSGLKSKLRGELADKGKKELAGLELPVLDLPMPASGRGGKHVVVLFQGAKGGIVVVDTPLDDLELGDQYEWAPVSDAEGDVVCGRILSDFGDPIPVVDVTRL